MVAAALGEHLGDLVADSMEDAQRAINHLKENQKGRARIWVLDRINASSPETVGQFSQADNLVSRIKTADKFLPVLWHLCSSIWIQNETAFGHVYINGGADPSKWKTHVMHRLPEWEESLSELTNRQKEWTEAIKLLESEILSLKTRRETTLQESGNYKVRIELLEEQFSQLNQKKNFLQEELQALESEKMRIAQEKIKAQEAQTVSFGKFHELQENEKTNHLKLDELQHLLVEFQQNTAQAAADLSTKVEKYKSFREKLEWQESVVRQSEEEKKTALANIEHIRNSIQVSDQQINDSRSAQENALLLISEAMGRRQEAADRCSQIQIRRTELVDKIKELETDLSSVRTQIQSLQESIQADLLKESNLVNKNNSLVQRLFEQYELSLEEAKNQFAPSLAEIETLDKLKKRVSGMGPINLAAPQEHAELSEKANFLITQQNDLLKAKDDLKQVITKINSTTREHFIETFQKVRENFRTLYSKLFQGGEADLRFTDEADILNTGIDIYCQPPGKKLLHISLLSGGEKALTAIALLFAFFQVRPSPIALMDEVDAPLDEANVLRYVDMIKTFSEQSQFILITHNKRTMESASALYGVTMEELGVSKILSARLSKKSSDSPSQEQTAEAISAKS
jgi:chromosome segregation protein